MVEASVAIERMCYGGAGFGRVDGKACFVPLTAPGDQARIRVVKEKKSFLEGELLSLETAASLRVAPPCPYFGVCGGCDWQHLPYEEQLRQKGEIFADSLRRLGKVEIDQILPVIGSQRIYGYRSRIQLKVARKNGEATLGFFRTGTHEVVAVSSGCQLADPLLNGMGQELRPLLARLPEPEAVTQVDLSVGDDGSGIALLHFAGRNLPKLLQRLGSSRDDLPSVAGLFVRSGKGGDIEKVFGIDSLGYRVPAGFLPGSPEMTLRFSRGGFSQINYPQNLALFRTVWEWGAFTGKERVLDLFCGNGNISIPIAPYLAEIVGVEGYAPSIGDAIANAAANAIDNAFFRVSDAALAVRRLAKRGERFDVVILDPPRGGAEAASEIHQLAPETILYVSCDPATLARDLGRICETGYRVTRSQPVDMFPQTYHLESVTELKRK